MIDVSKRIILALFIAFALFIPASRSDYMNSASYTMHVLVDEAGGEANSTTYRVLLEAGQYFGLTESIQYRLCVGHLCTLFGFLPGGSLLIPTVQFLLEANIAGSSGDVGYVDSQTAYGTYKPASIVNYVGCIEDTVLANDPTLGVVYAGSRLKYIKLETGASHKITMSQEQAGNRFVVPVASGGCGLIASQFTGSIPVAPYVPAASFLNAIELILKYPINIVGDFEKTGAFTIVLETNQTNITGEPV